jgi:succinate dehydrogenase/fumarate reductase cytochrome b subunit
VFIWLFHRISGLFLILLFGLKILTGLFLHTKGAKPEWALLMHRQPVLDVLILVLFTFHSVYGLRTVAIDLGWGREQTLFRWANAAGALIAGALLILYFKTIS